MTRDGLYAFLRQYKYGVVGTVSESGAPQGAVVGYAATTELEIVFDTLRSSRKFANLSADARCSFVVGGWDREQTVQLEGRGQVVEGSEREHYLHAYFTIFPDGRERAAQPEVAYVVLRPEWIRYSDYDQNPPEIREWKL